MAPLEERYKFFHMSLECSSVSQMGITQVFHHARSAALYPIAPLYDAKAGQLRSGFERAVRRLFRIYDVDRDGLLCDNELNAFQYSSFQVYLSEEDINALKKILEREAVPGVQDEAFLVRRSSEGVPGGITVDGFVRLMRLFIEKKQMKAPWRALQTHNYDDTLNLSLPPDVYDPPLGKAITAGGLCDQVLSPAAESFLSELFLQYSSSTEATEGRKVLTDQGQAEVFGVIPDPACAPWDPPRSQLQEDLEALEDGEVLFGRLRRRPGADRGMTLEAWMAHWQMLALYSPLLARAHLFYVGFKGHAEDMLVHRPQRSQRAQRRQGGGDRSVLQVFVLGSRGCGKSRVVKALRLGDDLLSHPSFAGSPAPTAEEKETRQGDQTQEQKQEQSQGEAKEASTPGGQGSTAVGGREGAGVGSPGAGAGEEGWEMVADPEFPEICAGFARLENRRSAGSPRASGSSGALPGRSLSVVVTEVPESFTEAFIDEQAWRCGLALLVFDPSSRQSLEFITPLLEDLPDEVPRLAVSCEPSRGSNPSPSPLPSLLAAVNRKCQELELSPVVAVNLETGDGLEGDGNLREKITDPDRAKDRNRNIRTAAIVAAVGLAVATGYLYAISTSREDSANLTKSPGGVGGAGRAWEAGVGGALQAPVRAAKRAASVAADYWRRWRSGTAGTLDEEALGHRGEEGGYRAAVSAARIASV
eukprot:jgi/Undpi1/612/HiC_scaffold_10.g04076.m1